MAFATQISVGEKKCWLTLAMAFPPLNSSEPTSKHFTRNANKCLRRIPLQYRKTERAEKRGNHAFQIVVDNKQCFSFCRDPALNRYKKIKNPSRH